MSKAFCFPCCKKAKRSFRMFNCNKTPVNSFTFMTDRGCRDHLWVRVCAYSCAHVCSVHAWPLLHVHGNICKSEGRITGVLLRDRGRITGMARPGTEERRRTKTGSVTGGQMEKHRGMKWHRGGGSKPEALWNDSCKREHEKVQEKADFNSTVTKV